MRTGGRQGGRAYVLLIGIVNRDGGCGVCAGWAVVGGGKGVRSRR